MRLLSLREYERRDYEPVTPTIGRALAATGLVESTLSLDRRLRLTAGSVVGVARISAGDETVELRVRPKMPIGRLLWLLGHARDPNGWRDDPIDLTDEHDLVPAVAVAFVAAASRALAPGVLQGYQVMEEALPLLRGRLREADQLRRRLGLMVPLEVRYDDYSTDIAENRILVSAVRRLHRLPGVPAATRQALYRIQAALAEAAPLPAGAPIPDTPVYRLTERYQPALRLARLILAGTGIEQPPGSVEAIGFAFDLNTVFEDWLTSAVRDGIEPRHGGSVTGQHRMHLDEDRNIDMRPDITWWDRHHCLAVVDAKYKTLHGADPPNPDIYQMLAYCTALGLRRGHLVYGSAGQTPTEYRLSGSGIQITVHGLNLSAPLTVLRAQIARICQATVAGATRVS